MDIIEFAEKHLGRKVSTPEARTLRSIMLARQRGLERPPLWVNRTALSKARYEKYAPIVDQYLQVNANA